VSRIATETVEQAGTKLSGAVERVGQKTTALRESVGETWQKIKGGNEPKKLTPQREPLAEFVEPENYRNPNSSSPNSLAEKFDSLDNYKNKVKPIDPEVNVQVAAELEMSGGSFRSHNSWAGRPQIGDKIARFIYQRMGIKNPATGKVPNSVFANHAEGGVLTQAYKSGLRGGKANLYVTGRNVCGWCKNSLPSMKNILKLDELNVFEKLDDGTINSYQVR
jgi:hypothetical protein